MGQEMGNKIGELPVTEEVSERLIRLPCYFELTRDDQDRVINSIYGFFGLDPGLDHRSGQDCRGKV